MFALLNQPWQYAISRNLSVWHSELNLRNGQKFYPLYGVPYVEECRIYSDLHVDFYFLSTGHGSSTEFFATLEKNFANPKYIQFLQKIYKQQGTKLLAQSKSLKPTYQSIKQFFSLYAKCLPMLDTTAMGSKFLTNKVLELLQGFEDIPNIVSYYAKPNPMVPLQCLERDIKKYVVMKKERKSAARLLHKKYAYLPANFLSEAWGVEYFEQRLKDFKQEKIHSAPKPKVSLPPEAQYYLSLLGKVTFLNEYRKSFFSQTNIAVREPFTRLAKSHGLTGWKDIFYFTSGEILLLAQNKKLPVKRLMKQRKFCGMYAPSPGQVKFFSTAQLKWFEKKFKPQREKLEFVQGIVASGGYAKGRARIVLTPNDFASFHKGDILIAKMTSVDFIPIMKHAGAFVTDEGGLASHAAVVAREYGIPCVVGTGKATRVFTDNDWVEVDTKSGVVRKILY